MMISPAFRPNGNRRHHRSIYNTWSFIFNMASVGKFFQEPSCCSILCRSLTQSLHVCHLDLIHLCKHPIGTAGAGNNSGTNLTSCHNATPIQPTLAPPRQRDSINRPGGLEMSQQRAHHNGNARRKQRRPAPYEATQVSDHTTYHIYPAFPKHHRKPSRTPRTTPPHPEAPTPAWPVHMPPARTTQMSRTRRHRNSSHHRRIGPIPSGETCGLGRDILT